ncbi:MAG: hypothetical protein WC554_10865 [Clostridia bacterium]|jgi:hypothetical protein
MSSQKQEKKKLRFVCWKCQKGFISNQARAKHINEDHATPKTTIEQAECRNIINDEFHKLKGGKNIKIGDMLIFTEKVIVTQTEKTEGDDDININTALIKRTYETQK